MAPRFKVPDTFQIAPCLLDQRRWARFSGPPSPCVRSEVAEREQESDGKRESSGPEAVGERLGVEARGRGGEGRRCPVRQYTSYIRVLSTGCQHIRVNTVPELRSMAPTRASQREGQAGVWDRRRWARVSGPPHPRLISRVVQKEQESNRERKREIGTGGGGRGSRGRSARARGGAASLLCTRPPRLHADACVNMRVIHECSQLDESIHESVGHIHE